MDDVKWIKIKVGMFDGHSFKRIKKAKIDGVVEFRDKLTAVWFEILDLGGKINNGGFLINNEIAFTSYEDIAIALDRSEKEIAICIEWFIKNNMMEIVDNIFLISNWSKYQNEEGLEKLRTQNAKRQKRFRANQQRKLLELKENEPLENDNNVTSNVIVTLRNAIEKEIDKDIIINNNKNVFVADRIVNIAIEEFIEFRKSIKSPMTQRAIELLIKKLDTLTEKSIDSRTDKIEILNQSILNGWKGVFPVNKANLNNSKFKKEIAVPSWHPDYEKQLKGEYKREEATPEELEELGKLVKEIME